MKRTIKFASLIVFGLIISGCSSLPDNTEKTKQSTSQATANKNSIESIEKQLAQFQAMKPSLERLVLVETELKALMTEIAGMSQQQEQKPSIVTPASAPVALPAPEITQVVSPAPKKQPVTEPSYSDYALQVFTNDNKNLLDEAWLRWSKKHNNILLNRAKIYQKMENNGTNYYRIKITNFTTKQEALDSCVVIKKQGGDCFLTNNIGQSF